MQIAQAFQRADQVVKDAIARGAFTSANVLVGQHEKVLFRRAYGRLGIEDDAPLTNEHTRYDLASLTKPLVVGMLSLRALESGKICLWDTLGTFIDAPRDKRDITIAQLLTHTAGFPTGVHLWEKASDPDDSAEVILNTPLMFQPGTRVHYCCVGYILLGQLLECLYGMNLSDLAMQEVFWPLRMQHTGYNPADGNIAATEMQDDGRCLQGIVHDENARFLGGVSGNAGVFGTMDDLALFLQMLAAKGKLPDGSRYLSGETIEAAFINRTPGMEKGRGLGFSLPWYENGYTGDLFPKETIGHTGFTGTSITLDPVSGLYIVFLTNRICPSRDSMGIFRVRRLLHNAVRAAL